MGGAMSSGHAWRAIPTRPFPRREWTVRGWPYRVARQLACRGERILYRLSGFPIAVAASCGRRVSGPAGVIRRVYAARYWRPESGWELLDFTVALLLGPFALIGSTLWLTWRNGRRIAARSGRSVLAQFADQLRFYVDAGILPPWYYIFSLHDRPERRHASTFLQRCETKCGVYPLLTARSQARSPLQDKWAFDRHCRRHSLPVVRTFLVFRDGRVEGPLAGEGSLPPRDLFVKPVVGCGGRGAERWDFAGPNLYQGCGGMLLTGAELATRLLRESGSQHRLVQQRLRNHPEIDDLSNGALVTMRILTCRDEQGRPEIVAAAFKMAVGSNRIVDNVHAGGIVATVDLASGRLAQATDLGFDARLGWLDRHSDTGARISGRTFPRWAEMRRLAEAAHRAFADRLYVGWDIALTPEGPCLVEGNVAPDVDGLQRPLRAGLANARFGQLLAFHLEHRVDAADDERNLGCSQNRNDASDKPRLPATSAIP